MSASATPVMPQKLNLMCTGNYQFKLIGNRYTVKLGLSTLKELSNQHVFYLIVRKDLAADFEMNGV